MSNEKKEDGRDLESLKNLLQEFEVNYLESVTLAQTYKQRLEELESQRISVETEFARFKIVQDEFLVQKQRCKNRIQLIELVHEMRKNTPKWRDFMNFYNSRSFQESKFAIDDKSDMEILKWFTHYDETELSAILEFAYDNMFYLKQNYNDEKMFDTIFLDIDDARSKNYEWGNRVECNMKKFEKKHPLIKCSYGGITGSTRHYYISLHRSFYLDGGKHMNRILDRLKKGDYKDLVSIENWKKIEKIIN